MKNTRKLDKVKLFEEAMRLHNEGKFDEADQIYQSVLKTDAKNFAANYFHGCVLFEKSKFKDAIKYLKIAWDSNPNNYEVNNNLGIVYKNLGEYDSSEKYFLKAMSIDENNFKAYFNCADLYSDMEKDNLALEFLEKCITRNDKFLGAHQRLGEICQKKYLEDRNTDHLIKAKDGFNAAIECDSLYSPAFESLGWNNLWLGDIAEANKFFNKANSLNCSDEKILSEYVQKYLHSIENISVLINHEYQQLTFIDSDVDGIRNPKFTREYYKELKTLYLKIKDNNLDVDDMTPLIQKKIFKILYNKPPKRLSSNLINERNDIKSLEAEYLGKTPEVVVIDNLLTQEALTELQKFCRNANVFKYPYTNGYVGSFLTKGLSSEFILKLSEDLRLTYKNIFKDFKLVQSWIFKCINTKKGVPVHADAAAVNVNLWIAPEHANKDKKSGGLKIWNKVPPSDWDFEDYNATHNEPRMKQFLLENEVAKQTIPYKENRVVIFNSKLFHVTDSIDFSDKYEDQRVNVTLLYE